MTKEEAKKILEQYQEIDDDTGEKINIIIHKYLGNNIFRCKEEGIAYDNELEMPEYFVADDGNVFVLPT